MESDCFGVSDIELKARDADFEDFGMFRVWVLGLELWEVSDFNFEGGGGNCAVEFWGPLGCRAQGEGMS